MTSPSVAFVPVRGGSKGVPGKNLRVVGGRPLLAWTVAAALASGVDRVVVACDTDALAAVATSLSPRVEVYRRSPESASDTAATEQVLLEWAEQDDFATVALLQATSPLTTGADVDRVLAALGGADSALSVTRQHAFTWSADGTPLNYDPARRPRRQDWDGQLVENGALYATSRTALLASGCRVGASVAVVEMAAETAYEIDTATDLLVVDTLLRGRPRPRLRDDRPLRLVATDVDGVLTDTTLFYGDGVQDLKGFSARDGKGFELLHGAGFATAFVTAESSPFLARRAEKVRATECLLGVKDKLAEVVALAGRLRLGLDQVAFVGDDVQDVQVMRAVREAWAPADAHVSALAAADRVTRAVGGHGAFREVADHYVGAF
ncbi:cytidylyltransferase domain-containing protein [Jatrophihabitans fulvus]